MTKCIYCELGLGLGLGLCSVPYFPGGVACVSIDVISRELVVGCFIVTLLAFIVPTTRRG